MNIQNTLKKNQKTIVLTLALTILALYLVPLDQIFAAQDNHNKDKVGKQDKEIDKCKDKKDKKHSDDCYRILG